MAAVQKFFCKGPDFFFFSPRPGLISDYSPDGHACLSLVCGNPPRLGLLGSPSGTLPALPRDVHFGHAREPRGGSDYPAPSPPHLQGAPGVRLRRQVRLPCTMDNRYQYRTMSWDGKIAKYTGTRVCVTTTPRNAQFFFGFRLVYTYECLYFCFRCVFSF